MAIVRQEMNLLGQVTSLLLIPCIAYIPFFPFATQLFCALPAAGVPCFRQTTPSNSLHLLNHRLALCPPQIDQPGSAMNAYIGGMHDLLEHSIALSSQ